MSIVVCKVYDNKICLAADSRISNSGNLRPGLSFDKIKKVGNIIVGSVGTCQEIQVLFNYILKNEPPDNDLKLCLYISDFYKYRNDICPKLDPEEKDSLSEGQYMFVIDKNIYAITNLFVSEIVSPNFHAIGSGETYAIGALETGASVTRAVEIACKYESGCGLPVKYMEVKR